MKRNVLKVLAMCKSVTNVQSGGGNSLSIKHEHKKMLKINHFASSSQHLACKCKYLGQMALQLNI